MSKAKVGVSMLYCLGEPFNRMVKRLGTMDTRYIEVLDDGIHELNKNRVALLKGNSQILKYTIFIYMLLLRTSTLLRHLKLCLTLR